MFKGRISMTKNWPGGRRKATVLTKLSDDSSVLLWNKTVVGTTKPYYPEAKPDEVDTSSSSNTPDSVTDSSTDSSQPEIRS